jgi:hypothetical protein
LINFVNIVLLTLKFIFVVAVIFKLDYVEPIKEFVLVKFELILPKDANILVPETVNEDKTEILSDVVLLQVISFAPLEDNVNESI